MKSLPTMRTVALVLGAVCAAVALLALAGAIASAVVGVNADQAGDRSTASSAKLACVCCLVIGLPALGLGFVLLVIGLIMHLIIRHHRRHGGLEPAFPVVLSQDARPANRSSPEHGQLTTSRADAERSP